MINHDNSSPDLIYNDHDHEREIEEIFAQSNFQQPNNLIATSAFPTHKEGRNDNLAIPEEDYKARQLKITSMLKEFSKKKNQVMKDTIKSRMVA